MHNVNVERLSATAEQADADPAAAVMAVHMEGDWNVNPDQVQFSGEVPSPTGSVSFGADFPEFLGGEGRAPTPLAYCFYGAMCCYGATFATQAAMAGVLYYAGTERGLSCANLRFYSIYGPYEDSSKLIPTVVANGVNGSLPEFVDPEISRDFLYVDDACAAFVDAALNLPAEYYGCSLNVGTGRCVTIREVAETAREVSRTNP